jgi:hypothetical protein
MSLSRVPSLRSALTRPVPDPAHWPSVGAVITTRDRPNLVRRALASVLAQDYAGPMRVIVVVDDAPPDWSLARSEQRPVLVMENWHRHGRAGARNTGILAAGDCEWVAFCDDTDTWTPGKLTAQLAAALRQRDATLTTCCAEVEDDGQHTPLRCGEKPITLAALGRGVGRRLPASGIVARYDALVRPPDRGGIGLLDEDSPAGVAEWDLLMRAARHHPVIHVDEPLVRVPRHPSTVDPDEVLETLHWMAEHHRELRGRGRLAAHHQAEIACWQVVSGDRAAAAATLRGVLGRAVHGRTLLALAAVAGLIGGQRLHDRLCRGQLPT